MKERVRQIRRIIGLAHDPEMIAILTQILESGEGDIARIEGERHAPGSPNASTVRGEPGNDPLYSHSSHATGSFIAFARAQRVGIVGRLDFVRLGELAGLVEAKKPILGHTDSPRNSPILNDDRRETD